jgi:DNA-binding NtrC family response regulator/tetratricopeptide (TPR) repeat protein
VAVLGGLVGNSPGLVAVRTQVEQLLRRQSGSRRLPPVLILGETGTGKGLLANTIHSAGPRAAGPFVAVNCAAIPETLLEAELFGFEQGALTDARHAKAGLFQTANRGTLFLDEIGLLPQSLQAKLLTVLEDRTVRRLGSSRSEPVDVWIISATSEDLRAGARRGSFREELYHRLAVVTLQLPALRERGQDILTLAEHFLARTCRDYGLAPKMLTDDARATLLAYRWPGNVRELANLMERVALLTDARQVTADQLELRTPRGRPAPRPPDASPPRALTSTSLEHAAAEAERTRILEALRETRGNISRAADRLGVTRNILRYRLKKYGLDVSSGMTEAPAPAQPVSPIAEPTRGPRTAHVQWERRHVALLWVGLVPPAAEETVAFVGPAVDTVVEKIGSFGGQVEEVSPSELVAAFGLDPVEDAPRRAAHAALAIQRAAHAGLAAESPKVRIGLHAAEVLVAWVGSAARVDRAAKREALRQLDAFMADAEAGVLVSEAARPFLERRFVLSPSVGGNGTAGIVYRLVGLDQIGLGLGDRLTPFVGRDRELEQLAHGLEQSERRQGQVVGIAGEAGVGKYQHTWNGRTYYAQLRLDALSPEDSQVLLDSLLGTEKAMASLKATLVGRTGGNPFFLEESVRTLVETDVLTGDRGAYGLSRLVGDIRVPATVQAVLAARVERLSPEDKTLLQTAAVIGKDVPFTLLRAIAERSDDALRRSLSNLQAAEFLYEARLLPDLEYTFKHALTQEVAYRSLLKQRRCALHVRLVEAIEATFPDRLTEYVERLADHALKGELWAKALGYMRQAGQKAALRSAHREAVPCFDQALAALTHLPDSRQLLEAGIDLRLELRNSLMALGEIDREGVLIKEARDRAEAIGDHRRLSQTLIFESNHFGLSGAPRDAVESAERALSMAEDIGDYWLKVQARYELAKAWAQLGDYRRGAQGYGAVVELIEGQGERRGGPGIGTVHSRTNLAVNLSELGEFSQALVRAEEALRIAEAAAYDFSVIHAYSVVGLVYARQGNVEMAIGPLERSWALSQARGIKIFLLPIVSELGCAYALSGRPSEAVSLFRNTRESTSGQLRGEALLVSGLGTAYLLLGQLSDARKAADEALELARRRSERGVEAWILRLLGEIHLGQEAELAHAEAAYTAAMDRAVELGMRPVVAHCHLGLGKLYRRTGKREQAQEHLTTATTMYREIDMRFWLGQAEKETGELR